MTDDNFDFDRLVEEAARRVEHRQKHSEANGADTGPDPELVEMNSKYAVVSINGKTRVVSDEASPANSKWRVPVYSTIQDFYAFHSKRKKNVGTAREPKLVGLGKWWISHDDRRQYDSVVYSPNTDMPGQLNLWRGFQLPACRGGLQFVSRASARQRL